MMKLFCAEEFLLNGDAERVVDGEVVLLNLVRLLVGCLDRDVGVAARDAFAARGACEGDGCESERLRHAEGVEDVLRVARGRDAEEDVLGLSES